MITIEELRKVCRERFNATAAQLDGHSDACHNAGLLAVACFVAERLRAALKQAHDAMEAFTDQEGNMPERTGEFNDLKKALHATSAALAATRKAEGNG